MVTRVGLSSLFPVSIQRAPLSKATKVALGALALFVLCVTTVVVIAHRNSREYKKIGQLLKELPKEVIEVFGGEEKVRSYSFHQLAHLGTGMPGTPNTPKDRNDWILNTVNQISSPIVMGIDQWGGPFISLRVKTKENSQRVGACYFRHNDTWYVNGRELFEENGDMNGPSSHIKTLISGQESTAYYPLQDLPPPSKSSLIL